MQLFPTWRNIKIQHLWFGQNPNNYWRRWRQPSSHRRRKMIIKRRREHPIVAEELCRGSRAGGWWWVHHLAGAAEVAKTPTLGSQEVNRWSWTWKNWAVVRLLAVPLALAWAYLFHSLVLLCRLTKFLIPNPSATMIYVSIYFCGLTFPKSSPNKSFSCKKLLILKF